MEKVLYQAGIIAIPLEITSNEVKPFPNFLVIEQQFGKINAMSPDLQTGILQNTNCVNSIYKLVFREILEESILFQKEFAEKIFINLENLPLPISLLPCIFSHQSIKDNISIVNLALSQFQFRGSLFGLILKVDENVLDEIIANEMGIVV